MNNSLGLAYVKDDARTGYTIMTLSSSFLEADHSTETEKAREWKDRRGGGG